MSKWKYGLELRKCRCDLDPTFGWDKCKDCNDFGEYWVTFDGTVIQIGDIEKWLKSRSAKTLERPLTIA